MDEDQNIMAERILDLTLEIIYLLTGEEITSVKSNGLVTINVPPPHSLKIGRNNEKILEVTKKIAELMTAEVPIRCQDVTVYFSMEEWKYLEGHKERYKDIMMASQPTLTSPDGSSNGNPPERYPRPLYSQDSTQNDNTISIKVEIKEEEEEMDNQQSTLKVEMTKNKPEEAFLDIGSDGHYFRNNSERRLESCDEPVEDDDTTQCFPLMTCGDIIIHRAFHMGTSMDGSDSEESSDESSDEVGPGMESSADSSNLREASSMHDITPTGESSLLRSTCAKSLSESEEILHRSHTDKFPFSCSECGKGFMRHGNLLKHQKKHTVENPISCSECGKCYTSKSSLLSHQRIHTGERPFSCSECGKSFTARQNLLRHQGSHKKVHPFACYVCGKHCTDKSDLLVHLKVHSRERPFPCSECEKLFITKHDLLKHQRIHTGERPFACSECGKCFKVKAHLLRHHQIHTGVRPYPCSECKKSFATNWDLVKHSKKYHTNKHP